MAAPPEPPYLTAERREEIARILAERRYRARLAATGTATPAESRANMGQLLRDQGFDGPGAPPGPPPAPAIGGWNAEQMDLFKTQLSALRPPVAGAAGLAEVVSLSIAQIFSDEDWVVHCGGLELTGASVAPGQSGSQVYQMQISVSVHPSFTEKIVSWVRKGGEEVDVGTGIDAGTANTAVGGGALGGDLLLAAMHMLWRGIHVKQMKDDVRKEIEKDPSLAVSLAKRVEHRTQNLVGNLYMLVRNIPGIGVIAFRELNCNISGQGLPTRSAVVPVGEKYLDWDRRANGELPSQQLETFEGCLSLLSTGQLFLWKP